jgi:hypothetical protein
MHLLNVVTPRSRWDRRPMPDPVQLGRELRRAAARRKAIEDLNCQGVAKRAHEAAARSEREATSLVAALRFVDRMNGHGNGIPPPVEWPRRHPAPPRPTPDHLACLGSALGRAFCSRKGGTFWLRRHQPQQRLMSHSTH